jgi:hypothetical protein
MTEESSREGRRTGTGWEKDGRRTEEGRKKDGRRTGEGREDFSSSSLAALAATS